MQPNLHSSRVRLSFTAAMFAIAITAAACGSSADDGATPNSTAEQPSTTTQTSTDDQAATGSTVEPDADTTATTAASDASDGPALPAAFWAIDSLTLDLVLVDTSSGDVLRRALGWGAELGDPDGPRQALSDVAAGADLLWIADCCEPAVGSVFGVDATAPRPVPASPTFVNGVAPTVSPEGSLLAVGVLDFGVAIHDASDGTLLVEPDAIRRVVSIPAEAPGFVSTTPLGWLDESTVAIGVENDGRTTITLVSVENPSAPAAVGPTIEVAASVVDAAVQADGSLVTATVDSASGAVVGRVNDTTSGEETAVFELPDRTSSIHYDPTGTFLLAATDDGAVSWLGGGESSPLAEGYFEARWADAAAIPGPPDGGLDLSPLSSGQVAAAGIDSAGGCSFYRNGVTGSTVFFSGIDGGFAVIDGEPVRFETDGDQDLGPFAGSDYTAAFTNVSDRVSSSIESSERAATLVVEFDDGSATVQVDGIMWCGV